MAPFFYKILNLLMKGLSVLPLRVLYILSDILYILVYYVVKYRRKVVRTNLLKSFPSLVKQEVKLIEKVFYHNLCDSFFETIVIDSISEEEIKKRMRFLNRELPEKYLSQGRSIILCLGHAGNWEWITSLALEFDGESVVAGQIYRPLRNQFFNNYYLRIRQKWGAKCIAKNETLREIVKLRSANKQFIIGFMADQAPSKNNQHYWTTFLNQDSSILTGPEAIAKKGDFVVLYLDVKKISRGYYSAEFSLISENPKQEREFEITERYARKMEETIFNDPASWLWSHKRWKHSRE